MSKQSRSEVADRERAGVISRVGLTTLAMLLLTSAGSSQSPDTIRTAGDPISVQPIAHGTLALVHGGTRVYIGGDTGCTAEMQAITDLDVAFVPMNLPYTMSPDEAAACVKAMKPRIVYPYHFVGSDPKEFGAALEGTGIEVRLRDWYARGR
jgi:L-ascorbate metabolism protein UlaG (beta-lactamase superfamily)